MAVNLKKVPNTPGVYKFFSKHEIIYIGKAKDLKLPSVVMIFEPQPQEFFSGERAPARLMRLREKLGNYAQVIQNVRGKGYRYEPEVER